MYRENLRTISTVRNIKYKTSSRISIQAFLSLVSFSLSSIRVDVAHMAEKSGAAHTRNSATSVYQKQRVTKQKKLFQPSGLQTVEKLLVHNVKS